MNPAEAAAKQREVRLTTVGRKSGKPRTVTIWIATDGKRLFVRSGQGMKRDWPQNLVANPQATLRLGGESLEVRGVRIADPEEARDVALHASRKYGSYIKPSPPGGPSTPGEQATFELIPID